MKQKWLAALSGTVAFSLLVGSFPAFAEKNLGRSAKHPQIEAKKGLSLRTESLQKKSSKYDYSSKLIIIQCKGPIEDNWKEQVEDLGIQLGDYIPDFAFIAKVSNQQERDQLKELPFVRRVHSFHPAMKLAPELAESLDKKSEVEVAVIGFDHTTDMKRTLLKMGEKKIDSAYAKKGPRHISTLSISGKNIEKLLKSDDVIAILPVKKSRVRNDVAAGIIHADQLNQTGYTGKDQIIGIGDTGMDKGSIVDIHPDLVGQVEKLYAQANPDDASDHHGHGTHVAGSALGTGAASDGKYKGMAPEAKLVFHSLGLDDDSPEPNISKMLNEAYSDGARIHSDSWGPVDFGAYSVQSMEFDQFIWEHPDMTALTAAGNDGMNEYGDIVYQSVSSPATAKNVISVGASESVRKEMDDTEADNENQVADFSSLGPTEDGRLKPDIVAPGTYILSLRSSRAPDDSFWLPFNKYYAYMGGTSMATPILAGGVAQIRQFLNEKGHNDPSAALIKSMLITGADVLKSADAYTQGFGRANLQKAIETDFVDQKKGLETKQKATYWMKVTDAKKPLAATLAWTDYPGSPFAVRTLVNDLNLKVISPSGRVWNGNDLFAQPYNDEVDNLNNVEKVQIARPEKGTYMVTVEGYNIPNGPQPFALSTNGVFIEEPKKEESKKGTLSLEKGKKKYIDYSFRVVRPGTVKLSAEWEHDADINLFLLDNRGKQLAKAETDQQPELLEYDVAKSASYKVRVQLASGDPTDFTLSMSYPGK